MITKDLLEYVKNKSSQGVPKDTLARLLVANGWEDDDITEVFDFVEKNVAVDYGVPRPKPVQEQATNPTQYSGPSGQIESIQIKFQTQREPQVFQVPITAVPILKTDEIPQVGISPQPVPPQSSPTRPVSSSWKLQPAGFDASKQQPQIVQPKTEPMVGPETEKQEKPQVETKPVEPVKIPITVVSKEKTEPIQTISLEQFAKPKTESNQVVGSGSVLPLSIKKNPMLIKVAPKVIPPPAQAVVPISAVTPEIAKPVESPKIIEKPQVLSQANPVAEKLQVNISPVSALKLPETIKAAPVVRQESKIEEKVLPKIEPLSPIKITPIPETPVIKPAASVILKSMGAKPISMPLSPIIEPATTPVTEKSVSKPKHGGKVSKVLIIVLILLLCIGGAAYAYFFLWNSPGNIQESVKKALGTVNSFKYLAEADVSVLSSKNGAQEDKSSLPASDLFVFKFDGSFDFHDTNNLAAAVGAQITAPVLFDKPFSFDGRVLGKDIYLNIPHLDILTLFVPKEVQVTEGTWIKASSDDVKTLAIAKPDLHDILISKDDESRINITPDKIKKFKNIILSGNLLTLTNKTGTETLNGVLTEHYHFTVDPLAFFSAIGKIKTDVLELPAENVSADDLSEMVKNMRIGEGDVWINKEDFLPYKILLSIEKLDKDTKAILTKTDLSIVLSDYNKNMEIKAPENVALLGDLLSKAASVGPQETTKNILQAARVSADNFAKQNKGKYNGICGSKNGFSVMLSDATKSNKGVSPVCKSAPDGWIIFMQYGTDKNTYWCMDSTGVNKEAQGPIIGLTCPL